MNGQASFVSRGRKREERNSQGKSNISVYTELDNHYLRVHADKARRIKERGSKCVRTAPEAMDGAIELLEELYFHRLIQKNGSLFANYQVQSIVPPSTLPKSLPQDKCWD